MTTGGEQHEPGAGGEAADSDEAAVVAPLREELEAARRRVREEWARYQQRASDDRTREAIAVSPLLSALIGLMQ